MRASEQIADAVESLLDGPGILALDCTEVALLVGMHPQRVGRWAQWAVSLLRARGHQASYAGRLFIICGAEHT